MGTENSFKILSNSFSIKSINFYFIAENIKLETTEAYQSLNLNSCTIHIPK